MPEAAEPEPGHPRHLVLIHGAWQGAWSFDAWAPLLRDRGWAVHAVDLPGNGWGPEATAPASLATYTDHVLALLAGLDGPAVVLGHSGGGITASQVAEAAPERVAALVYLAGMMLPSGLAYAELVRRCAAGAPGESFAGVGPHLRWQADGCSTGCTTEVPEAAALDVFLHDAAPAAARQAASRLRPQAESGRAMVNTLSDARYGRVPRIYVECTQDRSLRLPVQRAMQALSPGAQRLSLDCGHVPQLAQPVHLTARLCPVIEGLAPPNSLVPAIPPVA